MFFKTIRRLFIKLLKYNFYFNQYYKVNNYFTSYINQLKIIDSKRENVLCNLSKKTKKEKLMSKQNSSKLLM